MKAKRIAVALPAMTAIAAASPAATLAGSGRGSNDPLSGSLENPNPINWS